MKTPRSAESLGIHLRSRAESELFKWLLLCLLYGKPIQQEIAEQAFHRMVQAGLSSPQAIRRAGWDRLVQLLDEAHYVRYDFSTATKLLEVCRELEERYGSVTNLLHASKTPAALSRNLQQFKHVGPVTAQIFLREIRSLWYRNRRSPATRQRAVRVSGSGQRNA